MKTFESESNFCLHLITFHVFDKHLNIGLLHPYLQIYAGKLTETYVKSFPDLAGKILNQKGLSI